jgi:hypothetical protein
MQLHRLLLGLLLIGAVFVVIRIAMSIGEIEARANSKLIIPLSPGGSSKLQFVVPAANFTIASVLDDPAKTTAFGRSKAIPGIHLKVTQGSRLEFEGSLDRQVRVRVGEYDEGVVTVEATCGHDEKTPKEFFLIIGKPL